MKLIGGDKAIRTPEFHKKQERRHKIKLWLYALLAVLVLAAPFIVLRNARLQIANINISGNQVTKTEDIEKIVSSELSGSYFHLVPHASSFFYPKEKIRQDILSAEPRIASVDVRRSSLNGLSISVMERAPAALYCKDVSEPANPKDCFFLDASGYIFTKAPVFSGSVYSVYTSDPLLGNPLQTVLMTPEKLKGLNEFIKSVGNIPLYPEYVTIKGDEYDMMLSSGTHLLWKKDANLDDVYSSLDSFILDPTVRKQGISNLSYIDLRFDNKVFYKFKNE